MKYLSNFIIPENIQIVGLDLDGTLYDEFEFIKQAYNQVIVSWDEIIKDKPLAYNWMLRRWLDKGSSYPYIFEETIDRFARLGTYQEEAVKQALAVYHQVQPELDLSGRIQLLLTDLSGRFQLFIFTDGSQSIQMAKIVGLGLEKYFHSNTIFISGIFGKEYLKPAPLILPEIKKRFSGVYENHIMYIGDRLRDKEFAENCGFYFAYIQDIFKRFS